MKNADCCTKHQNVWVDCLRPNLPLSLRDHAKQCCGSKSTQTTSVCDCNQVDSVSQFGSNVFVNKWRWDTSSCVSKMNQSIRARVTTPKKSCFWNRSLPTSHMQCCKDISSTFLYIQMLTTSRAWDSSRFPWVVRPTEWFERQAYHEALSPLELNSDCMTILRVSVSDTTFGLCFVFLWRCLKFAWIKSKPPNYLTFPSKHDKGCGTSPGPGSFVCQDTRWERFFLQKTSYWPESLGVA